MGFFVDANWSTSVSFNLQAVRKIVCRQRHGAEMLETEINICTHSREAIEAHPMFKRISMIRGSSVAPEVIEQVKAKAVTKQRVLISLDSNQAHDHALAELEAYTPLTSVGSYCVVFAL